LLHVCNHALLKSLLFLGAGAVGHLSGTFEVDRLGGLLKRSPALAAACLVGVVGICGLPPLNAFAGEFVIYLAAFQAEISAPHTRAAVAPLAVLAGLAVIGGIAVVAFAKMFGTVFLGEAREVRPEPPALSGLMLGPLGLLAVGCVALPLAAPRFLNALVPAIADVTGHSREMSAGYLDYAIRPLGFVICTITVFVTILVGLIFLRARLLSRREVRGGPTWDCGYARPTPRMQYTGSSFVSPLTVLVNAVLRIRQRRPRITDYFPRHEVLASEIPEVFTESVYAPLFLRTKGLLSRGRVLQSGHVHLYVLYIALTLVVLLIAYLGLNA
jgi:hydrogenase-4 component B